LGWGEVGGYYGGVARAEGEDQHRNPAAHGVADGATHVLRAGVDVHDDRLRRRGDGVNPATSMGGAERNRLMRADDELGQFLRTTLGLGMREPFDKAGMAFPRLAKACETPASASASRNAMLVV